MFFWNGLIIQMAKKILVSGLINVEMNIGVNEFPVPYSPINYLFDNINVCLAGVAYNDSMGFRALGDEVALISIIGKDDIGDMVIRNLEKQGIDTSNIRRWLEKTCASAILFDEEGKRKIFCDLRNVQDQCIPYADVRALAASCDGLVLANVNFNDQLIRNARELGKPIFSDVQVLSDIHDPFNKRFMENATVLFMSNEFIKGREEEFARAIYEENHNKLIVIGCGKDGALLYQGESDRFYFSKAQAPRPVVNTVGAGDALFSGFVHHYLEGLRPEECLDRAVMFAAWKIGESGGGRGFISAEGLDQLMKRRQ